MAKTIKRTEVTVETETRVVWRRTSVAKRGWCEDCGAERPMLTPDAAAVVMGLALNLIHAQMVRGTLHVKELPDDSRLVCGASLGLG